MNRPDCKYICDCCDISGEFRCLCLENDLATLMRDFKEWVVENHFTPAAICYAHIVDNSRKKLKHIGNFILKEDGSVELVTVAPKRKKRK